tara:strand:- start:256 stop:786 length:531 start_codon:yes stop_codon:yes gene_type:complete
MSNLRLINETTTTAGVRLINITDVFTDDFQIYKIVGANMLGNNSTSSGNNLRFINSSGTVISSGYSYAQQVVKAETSFSVNQGTEVRLFNFFNSVDDGGQSASNVGYIFNPTNSNSYTFAMWESVGRPSGNLRMYKGIGVYPQLASITGFQVELNESASEFAGGGKIQTYGLRVDT